MLTVNAIIFLAPISGFDEWLVEDPSINRLVRVQLLHDPATAEQKLTNDIRFTGGLGSPMA